MFSFIVFISNSYIHYYTFFKILFTSRDNDVIANCADMVEILDTPDNTPDRLHDTHDIPDMWNNMGLQIQHILAKITTLCL